MKSPRASAIEQLKAHLNKGEANRAKPLDPVAPDSPPEECTCDDNENEALRNLANEPDIDDA